MGWSRGSSLPTPSRGAVFRGVGWATISPPPSALVLLSDLFHAGASSHVRLFKFSLKLKKPLQLESCSPSSCAWEPGLRCHVGNGGWAVRCCSSVQGWGPSKEPEADTPSHLMLFPGGEAPRRGKAGLCVQAWGPLQGAGHVGLGL